MNHLQALRELGQSLWLDNITREMLDNGTLKRYIQDDFVTGLTSNPTIFDEAIGNSDAYDIGIREKSAAGKQGEALFIELALEDLRRAADLFRPVFEASAGVDGWVSMELSPLLAADTAGSIKAASRIHEQAGRANLFVKIPGTPEGVPAIEESIFNGVPINVTLLFSTGQYQAAVEAYLRGIERRVDAGRDPVVASVGSLFVSRWDKASAEGLPAGLHNKLGIAVAQRTYRAYRELLASPRWKKLAAAGAHPSGCCGRAPAARTLQPPTPSTSKRLRRQAPSTRCQRRPCVRSPITARCAVRWMRMVAMPRPCCEHWCMPGSTSTHWPHGCSRKARLRS